MSRTVASIKITLLIKLCPSNNAESVMLENNH